MDWLSTQFETIKSYRPPHDQRKLSYIDYTERFHPLAFLIYQAERQVEFCLKNDSPPRYLEIVKATRLGECLFVLKEQKAKGLSQKMNDLISSNPEQVDKSIYEVEVAAAYARKRDVVEFIETQSDLSLKTPDLMINNTVEIECKKKERLTKRDKRNIEHWKLIMRKASNIMDKLGSNCAVVIKTKRDPSRQNVDFVLEQLHRLIKGEKSGKFTFADNGIGITLVKLAKPNQEIPCNAIEWGTSEYLDYEVWLMERKKGTNLIRNPRFFGFKSVILSDRVKSVLESIKHANEQLSGERPSLVYVDVNIVERNMMNKELAAIGDLTRHLLINISRISAVVLTAEFYVQEPSGYHCLHRARVIENQKPKYSLPQNFEIVGRA